MRLYTTLEAALDNLEGLEEIYPVTGGFAVMSLDESEMFIDCVVSDIKAREVIRVGTMPKIRRNLYVDVAEQLDVVNPNWHDDESCKAIVNDYVAAVMDRLTDYIAEVGA